MTKLLALLAMLAWGALSLHRFRERWMRRLFPARPARPAPPPPRDYSVTLETPGGRTGHVEYRQESRVCRLDWELTFGARDALLIRAPAGEAWDRQVPWAAGRRDQILARVAEEVVRQQCPGCTWRIGDDGVRLHQG